MYPTSFRFTTSHPTDLLIDVLHSEHPPHTPDTLPTTLYSILHPSSQGDFSVQPHMLQNTFALGYTDIGHFVQHVAEQMRSADDNDANTSGANNLVSSDVRLLIAATVVNDIRAAVKERTGYECSAGIAHNKILAKLVCGMNKPNKQTLLAESQLTLLYSTLSVRKIRGLGGKFGDEVCERLKLTLMHELANWQLSDLQRHFEEKNA